MSKRLGGNIIGCKNKASLWYLIGFLDDGSNMGSTVSCQEGPPVVVYNRSPYYTRHKKNTMSLDTAQFCYIGSRIGWVSALIYYHIISHQAHHRLTRQETRFCFLIIIRWI